MILSNQLFLKRIFTYHKKIKEGTYKMYDFIFEITEILEKDLNEYLKEHEK